MTLEQLNARIDAIDECAVILVKVFINTYCADDECNAMYDELRERFSELRNIAWNDFVKKIDEMSKQA